MSPLDSIHPFVTLLCLIVNSCRPEPAVLRRMVRGTRSRCGASAHRRKVRLTRLPGRHVVFLRWAIVLGIVGLSTGFIGPIVLSPESNQGPLVGIFFSGPAGALLGAVLGALAGGFALPPRTNAQILSVAAIALAAATLYFCIPQ